MRRAGYPIPVDKINQALPGEFVYSYLIRTFGPQAASGNDFDMDTDSDVTNSIFEYEIPTRTTMKFSRINFILVDTGIRPGDFGGINGGLTNGCLLRVIDADGSSVLQHFGTHQLPIKTNADFGPLSGIDIPIAALAGDDLLPVRFSIFKAGAPMLLAAGQIVRWVNRDDLSTITKFRAMVQGVIV